MREYLYELSELPGPTGGESRVQSWLGAKWREAGADVKHTAVGNLLARAGGWGPRILLVGHADEPGFVVRDITAEGFLLISPAGRAANSLLNRPEILFAQPVSVLGSQGVRDGITGGAIGHVLTASQSAQTKLDWDDIFIDVGLASRNAVEAAGISIGTLVSWNTRASKLGEFICGKSLASRASLAILTELLFTLNPKNLAFDVWIGSTIQHDLGLVGGAALALDFGRGLDGDQVLVLEAAPVTPEPDLFHSVSPIKSGQGPILVTKDSSAHYNRPIYEKLASLADRIGVPIQRAVLDPQDVGSDAAQFIKHSGVIPTYVALPVRYLSTPTEMVQASDLEQTLKLLQSYLHGDNPK